MSSPTIYAAIIAGGALTYSTKVKADPFKVIAEAIAEAVKYVYNDITESGYQMLWGEASKEGEKSSIAMGISTDSQNETSRAILDHKIMRIDMPEPMACKARTSRNSIGALSNTYAEAGAKITNNQTKASLAARLKGVRLSDQAKTYENRYGKAWSVATSGYGALPGKINLTDKKRVQLAYDWITTINGGIHDSYPSILNSLQTFKQAKRTVLTKSCVSEGCVSAANHIFANALSKRMAVNGTSTLQECKNEINRTYGDRKGQYRAHINTFAHPVPAMREALKLKAFNNYLKRLMIEEKERQLFIKSILLITKLTNQFENKKNKAAKI